MKTISIIWLIMIVILFTIVTTEQKDKGPFYIGVIITVMTIIPLIYIINN